MKKIVSSLILSLFFNYTTVCAPLHDAVMHNDIEKVKKLLDEGIDPNVVDYTLNAWLAKTPVRTALHIAAGKGYIKIVRLLLERGADSNAKYELSTTPLGEAEHNFHKEISKLLVEKGGRASTALHSAASDSSKIDYLRHFLKKMNPNIQDKWGNTPLHLAALHGNIEIAKLLLDNGADHSIKDNDGRTPLHIASMNGHADIVDILGEAGADANALDNEGRTPFMLSTNPQTEKVWPFSI